MDKYLYSIPYIRCLEMDKLEQIRNCLEMDKLEQILLITI